MRLAAGAAAGVATAAARDSTCSSEGGFCPPAAAQPAACAAAALRCCSSASPRSSASAAARSAASGPTVDGGLLPERDRALCRCFSAGGTFCSSAVKCRGVINKLATDSGVVMQAGTSSRSVRQASLAPHLLGLVLLLLHRCLPSCPCVLAGSLHLAHPWPAGRRKGQRFGQQLLLGSLLHRGLAAAAAAQHFAHLKICCCIAVALHRAGLELAALAGRGGADAVQRGGAKAAWAAVLHLLLAAFGICMTSQGVAE